jgi:hypothetical protein
MPMIEANCSRLRSDLHATFTRTAACRWIRARNRFVMRVIRFTVSPSPFQAFARAN